MTSVDLTIRLLKDLAEREDPRTEVQFTATRFNLTVARIKEIVARYGWPHPQSMARAAAVLEQKQAGGQGAGGLPDLPPKWSAPLTDPPLVPARQLPSGELIPVTPPPATGGPDYRRLRLADLHPHPSNPSGRTDDVADLAASIKQAGQLDPILVTEHPGLQGFLMLSGHRRHAALRLLGHTHADCKVEAGVGGDIDEQLFLLLMANIHRLNLNAMDKAYAFGDLRDRRKMTCDQIAERAGLQRGTVSYYLSLLELDAATQLKVKTGELPVSIAIEAVKKVRADTRRARGHGQAGHPIVVDPPWFSRKHPLAAAVKDACTHSTRPKVGATGCGECWEAAIREDATAAS